MKESRGLISDALYEVVREDLQRPEQKDESDAKEDPLVQSNQSDRYNEDPDSHQNGADKHVNKQKGNGDPGHGNGNSTRTGIRNLSKLYFLDNYRCNSFYRQSLSQSLSV